MPEAKPFTPIQERILRPFIRVMSGINTELYRRTDGRLGGSFFGGAPVCLLTTVGRKSGKRRTVALVYLTGADGLAADEVVVVASLGGSAQHPLWYLNLVADPEVEIQMGRERRTCTARTADAAERARLWPQLVAVYGPYESYQARTDREIPVVICTPLQAD